MFTLRRSRDDRQSFDAETRRSRGPSRRDFYRNFHHQFHSPGWFVRVGGAEAFQMIHDGERAESDLRTQSFVAESDIASLRQAAWAAFDTAYDLDCLDEKLIAEVRAFHRDDFVKYLADVDDPGTSMRELFDQVQERLEKRVAESPGLGYLAAQLEVRARLVDETRRSCDVVAAVAQRAEWMRTTTELNQHIISQIDEDALNRRRMALQRAEEISVMLADSLAEVAGVEAPKPELVALNDPQRDDPGYTDLVRPTLVD